MLVTYAVLLNSPGCWKQAKTQQPIGVVFPVTSIIQYTTSLVVPVLRQGSDVGTKPLRRSRRDVWRWSDVDVDKMSTSLTGDRRDTVVVGGDRSR